MPEEINCPRPNLDFTLDDNNLEHACPLDNGRHVFDQINDLAVLEKLPPELLHSILIGIDLRFLTDFRRVNKRAMRVVDSNTVYQSILRHSPGSLHGILSIGVGSYISCDNLIETLNESIVRVAATLQATSNFSLVGVYASCCFYGKQDYFPLLVSEAERKYGVTRCLLTSLPTVRSIPGRYSPNENSCKTRLTLIDPEVIRFMGLEHHGSAKAMEQYVAAATQKRLESYMQRAAAEPKATSFRPPKTNVQEGRMADPRRFMAIAHAPWIDRFTNTAVWGFHCGGCKRQYRSRPRH